MSVRAEMKATQEKMTAAKKNGRTSASKEVKLLHKEFGFTAGRLNGALA